MSHSVTRSRTLPDAAAHDTGLILVGTWTVDSPQQQRAAITAACTAWEQVEWPDGLLSTTTLTGTDGTSVVHMSRWRDEPAAHGFAGTTKHAWAAAVDAAVPGIKREGVLPYQVIGRAPGSRTGTHPASGQGRQSQARVPGCVVLVDIATENRERATEWVASMLELPPVDTDRTGLCAATFQVSLDGTRVLNLAEWVDEESHIVAAARQKEPDEGRLVMATPGVKVLGYRRFTWWETVTVQHSV